MVKLLAAGALCVASSGQKAYQNFKDYVQNLRTVDVEAVRAQFIERNTSESKLGQQAFEERVAEWIAILSREQIPVMDVLVIKEKNTMTWKHDWPLSADSPDRTLLKPVDADFVRLLETRVFNNPAKLLSLARALAHYAHERYVLAQAIIDKHLPHAHKSLILVNPDYASFSTGEGAVLQVKSQGEQFFYVHMPFKITTENSPLIDTHGYLASITSELAHYDGDLIQKATELAQRDTDRQAGMLLHEIGHVVHNDGERYEKIKFVEPFVQTVTGALALGTALILQDSNSPLLATALLSLVFTTRLHKNIIGCSTPHSFLSLIDTQIAEYRADSYALKHATDRQLQYKREAFELGKWAPEKLIQQHPYIKSRLARINAELKKRAATKTVR